MAYEITTPSNDQTYSLVSDLQGMATQITAHLNAVANRTTQSPSTGGAASFVSITCTGTGTFNQIAVVGSRPSSTINNDSTNGFGLKAGTLTFSTRDNATWSSSGHINLPTSAPSGNNAITFSYINPIINTINSKLSALEGATGTVPTDYVSLANYNAKQAEQDGSINSLRASVQLLESGKANAYGNVTSVQYAASAGSTASATTANNALYLNNRKIAVGRLPSMSIVGGGQQQRTINHGLPYTPMIVLAGALFDDGNVSIICSTSTVTATQITIRARNMNASTTEVTTIGWMAM